ncbi:cytochrome c oxidase assembly protein COX19 [Sitodiplosis mosellana]|uniref:cytochrome c oxidase assembly protein COX19 n=1 Tax=Sitodiplosis mosellana TaxID=263140 RepID=UPI00244486FC|nr:cytochrome c oxidase assembly protein COX19 [Sitodiplosis mosellana]XP_055316004.1 cytochrome c oxidase assembly protein COX19 [Sitodiplosis mosellana]
MSAATFGQKRFNPVPPDKGSFPLDHENVCKVPMLQYMKCLQLNRDDSTVCRQEAKKYLECRMENNLMAKEEWKSLGFQQQQQPDQPSTVEK